MISKKKRIKLNSSEFNDRIKCAVHFCVVLFPHAIDLVIRHSFAMLFVLNFQCYLSTCKRNAIFFFIFISHCKQKKNPIQMRMLESFALCSCYSIQSFLLHAAYVQVYQVDGHQSNISTFEATKQKYHKNQMKLSIGRMNSFLPFHKL